MKERYVYRNKETGKYYPNFAIQQLYRFRNIDVVALNDACIFNYDAIDSVEYTMVLYDNEVRRIRMEKLKKLEHETTCLS